MYKYKLIFILFVINAVPSVPLKDEDKNFKLIKHFEIEIGKSFDKWDKLGTLFGTELNEKSLDNSYTDIANVSCQSPNIDNKLSQENSPTKFTEQLSATYEKLDEIRHYLEILNSNNQLSLSKNENLDYKGLCRTLVGVSKIPQCKIIDKANKNSASRSFPKSCKEIQQKGNATSGIYEIQPKSSNKSFTVLCDMDIRGGGWTHIQKRLDGSENFYREWYDYKFGFGDLDGEFWMGLENIYHMTGYEINELLVEIVDKNKIKAYAYYSNFELGNEQEGYSLSTIKGYNGDAGDAMTYHLGQKFSTKDLDQDKTKDHCAIERKGGWWYKDCYQANLNGKFVNIDVPQSEYLGQGLHWRPYRGDFYSHSSSRMLIRPAQG